MLVKSITLSPKSLNTKELATSHAAQFIRSSINKSFQLLRANLKTADKEKSNDKKTLSPKLLHSKQAEPDCEILTGNLFN